MAELSRVSGVSVPTIKFYLREGLLPEGKRTSATQAQYDDGHVARLRLIRALLGTGGLTVARARDVMTKLDEPPDSTHDLLGVAHKMITPQAPPDLDLGEVRALLAGWGWQIDPEGCDNLALLAQALTAAREAGLNLPPEALDRYAERLLAMATDEVAAVPSESAAEAVRYVVLGTVLVEPILLAMRRLAQQEASSRLFGTVSGEQGRI